MKMLGVTSLFSGEYSLRNKNVSKDPITKSNQEASSRYHSSPARPVNSTIFTWIGNGRASHHSEQEDSTKVICTVEQYSPKTSPSNRGLHQNDDGSRSLEQAPPTKQNTSFVQSPIDDTKLSHSSKNCVKLNSNLSKSSHNNSYSRNSSKGVRSTRRQNDDSVPLLKSPDPFDGTDLHSDITGFDERNPANMGASENPKERNANNSCCMKSVDTRMSHGSSAAGDSFVLPLDWNQGCAQDDDGVALFHTDPMNQSFDDPYLLPLKSRQSSERPCNSREIKASLEHNDHISQFNNRTHSISSTSQLRHPSHRSGSIQGSKNKYNITGSPSTRCSKSLGTFDFPATNELSGLLAEDTNVVLVPRNLHNTNVFEAVNDDSGIDCTVSTDEDEEQSSDSRHCSESSDLSIRINAINHDDVNEYSGRNTCNRKSKQSTKTARERALIMVEYYKTQLGNHYEESRGRTQQSTTDDDQMVSATPHQPKAIQSGNQYHLITIGGLWMDLGHAEFFATQFENAVESFLQAACIYRDFGRPVATAKALDRAGVAYCRALKYFDAESRKISNDSNLHDPSLYLPAGMKPSGAMQCLRDALAIRQKELGPWHIDTVDTLNHMANLYLLTGNPLQAAMISEQVFYLRDAIFGPLHPAVGVVAHEVANATLQSDSMHNDKAKHWYQLASDIYQALNLPLDNPAVQRLLKDIRRMERLERWKELNSQL